MRIGRRELKKRLQIVAEAYPGSLLRGGLDWEDGPGCSLQIALNTEDEMPAQFQRHTKGVSRKELERIVVANDSGKKSRLNAAIAAL